MAQFTLVRARITGETLCSIGTRLVVSDGAAVAQSVAREKLKRSWNAWQAVRKASLSLVLSVRTRQTGVFTGVRLVAPGAARSTLGVFCVELERSRAGRTVAAEAVTRGGERAVLTGNAVSQLIVEVVVALVRDERVGWAVLAVEGVGVGVVLVASSTAHDAWLGFGHVLVSDLAAGLAVAHVVVLVGVLRVVEKILSGRAEGTRRFDQVGTRLIFTRGTDRANGSSVDVLASQRAHFAGDVFCVINAIVGDVLSEGAERTFDVVA